MRRSSEIAELQKLCSRSFPERLDQRISQIAPIAGERHPMLGLTLAWREGQRPRVERLILRRYADPWTWWAIDDRAKARREWTVMRWLYGEGLPVPRLYAYGSENGQDLLLMARISAKACTATEPHVEAFAAVLAQLHYRSPPAVVRQVLPNVTIAEELERLQEIAHQCEEIGLLNAINDLFAQEMEGYPPCVLHGAPQFDHVLCDARGITALLDWENSALGDPRWDVGRFVNWLRIRQVEGLVDHFCMAYEERSDRPLSNMAFWEALATVQNWALASWVRVNAPPTLASREALCPQIEAWREQAWRALTRLRYEKRERPAVSGQPSATEL
jgi:aminoglycoside phosphotransferase (APT) family kinase protein